MKMKVTKKLTIGTLFVGIALASSVAFAAWTTNGTGSGYAKAKSAVDLTTVNASASTTAQLYPGGTGDLVLKISNTNPYNVTVTAVNNGVGSISSSAGASCDGATTGVSFTNTTGSWLVPAGTTQTFTLANRVSMDNTSDTTCQGAVFTIPVALVGASS